MPRKKKAELIPETTPTQPAQIEETPERSQPATETNQPIAEPASEPEKPLKRRPAKAKAKKQTKNEEVEPSDAPLIDKRQLILPEAENLFQEEMSDEGEIESENKDEPATETKTETREPAAIRPTALKLSVSLYERDVEALDNIREFLRGYGVRKLTDSEAIRIAVRATAPDEKLVKIYEQLKTDDKRRK